MFSVLVHWAASDIASAHEFNTIDYLGFVPDLINAIIKQISLHIYRVSQVNSM